MPGPVAGPRHALGAVQDGSEGEQLSCGEEGVPQKPQKALDEMSLERALEQLMDAEASFNAPAEDPPITASTAASSSSNTGSAEPPPPPSGAPPRRGQAMGVARAGHGEPWGCFWFVLKTSGRSRGAQVTCPFHRGTDTAPACKKFMAMRPEEEDVMCILRLKAWCVAAPQYDRKYKRLAHIPRDEDLDGDALDQRVQRLSASDRGTVLPDSVLDLQVGLEAQVERRRGRRVPAPPRPLLQPRCPFPTWPAVQVVQVPWRQRLLRALPLPLRIRLHLIRVVRRSVDNWQPLSRGCLPACSCARVNRHGVAACKCNHDQVVATFWTLRVFVS